MLFDYIIVGAGPSGATIAYCLQKEGANCLIVDKKAKIEEKTLLLIAAKLQRRT